MSSIAAPEAAWSCILFIFVRREWSRAPVQARPTSALRVVAAGALLIAVSARCDHILSPPANLIFVGDQGSAFSAAQLAQGAGR